MPTSWAPLVCIVQQCSSALREGFFVLGQLVGCLRSHQLKGYHRDRINIKQLILSALQSLLLVFAAHCYKNSHFQCSPLPDGSSAQPVCGLLLPVHQPVAEKSKVRALSEVFFFLHFSHSWCSQPLFWPTCQPVNINTDTCHLVLVTHSQDI